MDKKELEEKEKELLKQLKDIEEEKEKIRQQELE